jgi:sodium transport system permease protein
MRLSSIAAIYRKEMTDTVRDRRTLISMVIVPLAVIPLLFGLVSRFTGAARQTGGGETATVAVRNAERLPGLLNGLAAAGFKLRITTDDLKAEVERNGAAAGVEPVPTPGGGTEVAVYSDLTRPASEAAASRVRAALDRFRENSIRLRLMAMGVPQTVLDPFQIRRVNAAGERKMAGLIWGNLFGFLVVILMFSGGMYAAIDMTAGEKERRTLEILLASSAARGEIIAAKVLATTSVVFFTALVGVGSIAVSVRLIGSGALAGGAQPPLNAVTSALAVLALVPTAFLAASLMVAVALFAKSFKEAQSYLTPLLFVVTIPLLASFLAGAKLTPVQALIPLLNVCQFIRQLFLGDFSPVMFAIMMLANTVYAALAFLAALRIFNNERVLFRT